VIKLNAEQWDQLKVRDAGSFVAAVCEQFLSNRLEMVKAPGRGTVQDRMQAAHDYAGSAGFTNTPHIVQFMYMAADYPGFHDDALVDIYLRKPGGTPEQRFDDMLAVLKRELLATQRNS
jgi:hypothetical protein